MAANSDLYLSLAAILALFSLIFTLQQIDLTISPPSLFPISNKPHTLYFLENATHASSPDAITSLEKEKTTTPLQEPPTGHAEEPEIACQDSIHGIGSVKKRSGKGIFHDEKFFAEDYKEMNRSFKIYVYPHSKSHQFAKALLPMEHNPGGNYASEAYFKKSLVKSHFVTEDPSKAHLFFLPFSITALRNDRAIGVKGIPTFVRNYVSDVSKRYPYWNRSGGADHFYVACHSVGRSAMTKTPEVRTNAIQVVCSSSYFLAGYISHKDASIPQIWPRKGPLPYVPPKKRTKLAFYAGAMNSRLRRMVVDRWGNDTEISVHAHRLSTPYGQSLLSSKFCLHVKGFEVNTARVADAIFHGCIPVILADHYVLPFADILDWTTFAIIVPSSDIPRLKEILQSKVGSGEYDMMYKNVLKVRRYFKWNNVPNRGRDVFQMVMYELWLRRSVLRFAF